MKNSNALLQVKNLSVGLRTENGYAQVIESLSFSIHANEAVGIVGETGSGKDYITPALAGLLPGLPEIKKTGDIFFSGENLSETGLKRFREIRGRDIGVIFRESATQLDPLQKIGRQVIETLQRHSPRSGRKEIFSRAIQAMKEAGISEPEQVYSSYPHVVSANVRQRLHIAIAIMMKPRLLIADDAVALPDATIRVQITEVIKQIRAEDKSALLFITSGISIAAELCSRIIVMYSGIVAEIALKKSIFDTPLHPYTIRLLSSLPFPAGSSRELHSISADTEFPAGPAGGCRFLPCCNKSFKKCGKDGQPPLFRAGDDHFVSCWLYGK